MSQNATFQNLEQRIQALEQENASLKQDIAALNQYSPLESIFKTAPIGLVVLVNEKIVRVNKYFCDITGYSTKELTGLETRIFYPDEASYRKVSIQRVAPEVVHGHKSIEARWQTKSKQMIDVTITFALIDECDFEKGQIVTVQDITTRKKIEKEKSLLLAAMEQAPVGVFIIDPEGIVKMVNATFERQSGYPRKELVGMDIRNLRSRAHDSQFYINMWATISAAHVWHGHMINKRKDGSLYTNDTTISSVKDENGDISDYVGVQRDISGEIEINEKMAQIQKIESLGILAGGISHDLNNMLFPILGNTELLLLEEAAFDNGTIESLQQIYESALQAKALVQQVLTFSRRRKIERCPVLIQNGIDSVLKLMKSSIPGHVSINTQVDSNCPFIEGNSTQIHQIIMNLLSNSVDAMEGRQGVVTLSLNPVNFCRSQGIKGGKPGNYVCLSVRDFGVGMSRQVMDQIFEPFYTTKEDGKGTGMGLSVVYGIVKDMNGEIKVSSQPGKGSEFNVYFPIPSNTNYTSNLDVPGLKKSRGPEDLIHVLFVDDEELILKVAKSMLDRLGCRATTMTDPVAALDHFKKAPLAYDIVITDMHMPKMKGDGLAQNIRQIRPDIPVFLCTGFCHEVTVDLMAQTGIRAVFSKPLSIKDIADKIQEILKPGTQVL